MDHKRKQFDPEKLKPTLEAILFSSGRPVNVEEFKTILKIDEQEIKNALDKLKEEYDNRKSGLEIFYFQNHYVMQVRKEYSRLARKFAPGLDISRAALKTLSLIAMEQPIMKSKVVEIRGKHAYKHIKELIKQGYVKAEKAGKSSVLKTTERFASLVGEENIKRAKIKKEPRNGKGNPEEKAQ
jgi:segregation and condensation protein B